MDDFVGKWEVCIKAGSSHAYILFHFHDNYEDVTRYARTNQQSAEAFFTPLVEPQEAWLEKNLCVREWGIWGLMQARSSEGCGCGAPARSMSTKRMMMMLTVHGPTRTRAVCHAVLRAA